MFGVFLGYLLGLLSGVRHAIEPDHVAAVTTIAAGEKRTSRVVGFAASWGLGHALMLLGVGGALFALKSHMPNRIGEVLELGVALALIALGVRGLVLAKDIGEKGASHAHVHKKGHAHVHEGPKAHVHVGRVTFAKLPFFVGIVHGLSGSGALTVIAVSKRFTIGEGLVFMALYSVGTVFGMAILGGVAGVPLSRLARKPRAARLVVAFSGAVSFVVGVVWALPILRGFT